MRFAGRAHRRALLAVCASLFAPSVISANELHAETLRMAVDILPPSLGNPYRTSLPPTAWTVTAIFDALTRFDRDGRLLPGLAVRWEKIDGLTWRFDLREDVTFHNGAPFTAEAVAAAVEYVSSEAAAREGLKRELPPLTSVRAVGPYSVEITTADPAPQLARAMSGFMIAEPRHWRAVGRDAFARDPVGTGPFKMEKMTENEWDLSAFQGGPRKPQVDGLDIVSVPDAAARVQSLLTGRQHIAMGLNPDATDTIRAAGGRVYTSIEPAVFGISFITFKSGPWQDVRVRRALNMAVNRQGIIDVLLAGATVPSGQPAARNVIGYNPEIAPYPYDPDAARALLADAGFPDGFTFILECATGIDPNDAAVYQQLQNDLAGVGVTMQIKTMPATQFYNALRLTDFSGDAFPIDWPSWPTLDVTRGLNAHSCERINPWYCDPESMPLLIAARTTWNEDEGLALKHELMRRYHDAAPAIFMYETANFVGLSEQVAGFDIVNGTHIAFEGISLKQ